MKKNCLTCKYEPEWGDPTKGEYARVFGTCQWPRVLPTLPSVYRVHAEGITRFLKDDSGIETRCPTWTAK